MNQIKDVQWTTTNFHQVDKDTSSSNASNTSSGSSYTSTASIECFNNPCCASMNEINIHHDIVSNEHYQSKLPPSSNVPFRRPKSSPAIKGILMLLRLVVLDLPLFMVLLTYASLLWLEHVHVSYLKPQLISLIFSESRSAADITYYRRPCTAEDMSTWNGDDLFLPTNATSDEARDHQLKHGFTIFRGALQPETATRLRTFVDSRNRILKEEEKIFVIEGQNRYSFGLGTEEPSVVAAVMELTNHAPLKDALENVLGKNPALIEMTAITSAYGAVDQYWHDDVIPTGSAINFGRAFGPSYSIFVQLQNTTKAMGATAACPGTHYCSDGDIDDFCDQHGFQLTNSENNDCWGIGDALLMNMNSYHRGAAHTDPNAPDRVMFILTFVPKPLKRAETRQMSQGITFSLRWDMWGHTLYDLAHADTMMKQPWATLRALGLYKMKPQDPNGDERETSWGIDYITSASMRMANEDNGFRQDELDIFLKLGGFPFVPQFLQSKVNFDKGESWYHYLSRTLRLCLDFFQYSSLAGICVYLFLFTFVFVRRGRRIKGLYQASVRMICLCAVTYILYKYTKQHVDRSDWAHDITHSLRYSSTSVSDQEAFKAFEGVDDSMEPSTFPTKHDVLIETRYGSEHLALYNDFIPKNHPGNAYMNQLMLESTSQVPYGTFAKYEHNFQDIWARNIIEEVRRSGGRILIQNGYGYWLWIDPDYAVAYTKRQLAVTTSPALRHSLQQVRFLRSHTKYGPYRYHKMVQKHAGAFVHQLEQRLLQTVVKEEPPNKNKYKTIIPKNDATDVDSQYKYFQVKGFNELVSLTPSDSRHVQRPPSRIQFEQPRFEELTEGAWLAGGDDAEAYYERHWYACRIRSVNAHGTYYVAALDGSEMELDIYTIRRMRPFVVGEEVEVARWDVESETTTYNGGTILRVTESDYDEYGEPIYVYDVHVIKKNWVIKEVAMAALRRKGSRNRFRRVVTNAYHQSTK